MELRKLFVTRTSPEPEIELSVKEEESEQKVRITYYQSGYGAAIKAMGAPINFKACLENVYGNFEQQCRDQHAQQEKLKQPYVEDKGRKQSELKNTEAAISLFEEKKQALDDEINVLKNEIVDVKQHPEKYGVETSRRPKAQFYIGLFLLLPITLYLFVFYISASYSAFFKTFSDDALTAAIFDADALKNAWKTGWLEAVLIFTIPTVFLGLGYTIHMVQKGKGIKSMLRIAGLFAITFLFDALLAYQIEKKIYEFNKTPDSLPYNLRIALSEAEFWMIIFAGFVVYLIWGLVFDITMKEYDNIDKIKAFINTHREKIGQLETARTAVAEEISRLRQKITELTGKITELQSTIDGFVLNLKQYLLYHNQYKEGWFMAVASEIALPRQRQEELLGECESVATEHLKKLNLIDADFENVVYSKIS